MTWAVGIVAALALILAVVFARAAIPSGKRRRDRTPVVSPWTVRTIDPDTQAQVAGHLAQGKKIQAIKDLRAATGLGLKEAKDAVDAMAAGHDISGLVPPRPELPATTEARARELIARGQKIQAIKLIREETGLGLKEAKDLADGLHTKEPGEPWESGR